MSILKAKCTKLYERFILLIYCGNPNFIPFIVDEVNCKTNGGNQTNQICKFPFKWNGYTYESCVFKKHGAWCSTKVDSNGTHIQGYWGKCENHCNVEKVPDNFSSRMAAGRLLVKPF